MLPLIAIVLAGCGWWLVTQLAKQREAQTYYDSVISLLEHLDKEGREAWTSNQSPRLDPYSEAKLLIKLVDVERRLQLIARHYCHKAKETISATDIAHLRMALTRDANVGAEDELTLRTMNILSLTSRLASDVVNDSVDYINRQRTLMARVGITAISLAFLLSLPWSASFIERISVAHGPEVRHSNETQPTSAPARPEQMQAPHR